MSKSLFLHSVKSNFFVGNYKCLKNVNTVAGLAFITITERVNFKFTLRISTYALNTKHVQFFDLFEFGACLFSLPDNILYNENGNFTMMRYPCC